MQDLFFGAIAKHFLISLIKFGIIVSLFHARGPAIPDWMTSRSLTYLRKSGFLAPLKIR